ncbi:hypothetical protein [Caproicibacter sp.]|uniref:hypothetical protein n=1 Tax=Caproicibacter sp. TaxID=2814884 RepID=UPI00398A3779
MRKRKLFASAAVSILILILASVFVFQSSTTEFSGYQRRWQLHFPFPMQEQFSVSDLGFTNDGDRYAVFSAEKIPGNFFSGYHSEKNVEIESFIDRILNELKIADKNRPNLRKTYRWIRNQKADESAVTATLVILYCDKKFYFIEEMI